MNSFKKIKAQTLAEVMIVVIILAVIAAALAKVYTTRLSYLNRYYYYGAFVGLKTVVNKIVDDGYTLSGNTTIVSKVPNVANNETATVTDPVGFCQRLREAMNILGSVDCSVAATDGTNFNTATPTLIVSSGARYFMSSINTTPDPDEYYIYIDIDGKSKGKNTLNTDVMKFSVNLDGRVIPYNDSANSVGFTSTDYLATSVRYKSGNSYVYPTTCKDASLNTVVCKGLFYQSAACAAGTLGASDGCGSYTKIADCTSNTCEVTIDLPKVTF